MRIGCLHRCTAAPGDAIIGLPNGMAGRTSRRADIRCRRLQCQLYIIAGIVISCKDYYCLGCNKSFKHSVFTSDLFVNKSVKQI